MSLPLPRMDTASSSTGSGRADIGAFAVRDHGKRRDVAAKVQLAVKFDGSFGSAELSPGEQFQAQVDGAAVERIGGILEAEFVFGSDLLATIQKMIKEFFHDAVVPLGVGIRQSRTFDRGQPEMIKLGFLGSQSRLNVPQAVLAAGLGIKKGGQLVPCGEFLDVSVPEMLGNRIVELMSGHEGQQLAHNCVRMHLQNPPRIEWLSRNSILHLQEDFCFFTGHE